MGKKILKIMLFWVLMSLYVVPVCAAETISVNTWKTDYLVSYNDINEYSFRMSSDGNISVSFKHDFIDSSSSGWKIKVYNSNGDIVLERSFSCNQTQVETTKIGLPSGNYRITVEDGSKFSDINYQLRINYTASSEWEKENNDTYNQANSISVNKNINGFIEDYDDDDYYKFSLNSAGYLSLTFNHEYIDRTSSGWQVIVYNSAGTEILSRYFYCNQTQMETAKIGLPSGSYHMVIKDGSAYYDVPYTFKINYTASTYWEQEINDTYNEANSITVNREVNGSIEDYSDDDYYKFSLNKAGYISLTFNHEYIDRTSSGWQVIIYNSAGTEILNRYFYCNQTKTETTKIGLPAGSYHLVVKDGSAYYDVPYTFSLNYVSSSTWEREINNTYNEANNINVNTEINGSIEDYSDDDYYKFSLSKAGYVSLTFKHGYIDSSSSGWKVEIFNSNGNSVLGNSFKCNLTSSESDKVYLPAGSYHIKVIDASHYDDMPYTLCVNYSTNIFRDVSTSSYYYNAILWAVDNNITSGMTSTLFEPNSPCTRAQIVTFLWRAAGEPSPGTSSCTFKDVDKNAYYYKAMLWAVKKGITTGYSNTVFAPNATCTRAEMVTFLWRANGKPSVSNVSHNFSDVSSSAFYYKPMLWALKNKIVNGYSNTKFAPYNVVTRCETVTFLYRTYK